MRWLVPILALVAFHVHLALAADCIEQASEHLKNDDEEAAVDAVTQGARDGDERCKYILGMWLLSGAKSDPDPEAGFRWLRRAANDGLPTARAALGLLYASGIVVERDDAKAARLYRSAAEYGDLVGQLGIGLSAYLGIGVAQDRVEAYKWMSLAAEQGNERAREHLPVIASTLSAEELQRAKQDAEAFEPRVRAGNRKPSRKDLLRVLGLNRPPGEIERFFGFDAGHGP